MIRINLLGQRPPKVQRAAMPAGMGSTLVLLFASIVVAGVVLWYFWNDYETKLQAEVAKESKLRAEKDRLDKVRQQVIAFENERAVMQRQIDVIKALDRNRTGGQELLDSLAGTVVRTDGLWLTNLGRKGNSLTLEGTAGSIRAVANFITQLKRSGYFDRVEIKEARQDERSVAIPLFLFSLTADFTLPTAQAVGGATGPGPKS
jgi:Tfp pilus assembly protein PilN